MIKAPMCKVCGEPHFGPDHIWKGRQEPERIEVVRSVPIEPIKPAKAEKPLKALPAPKDDRDEIIDSLRKRVAELEAGVKPRVSVKAGEDRAAYMREYRKLHPPKKAPR